MAQGSQQSDFKWRDFVLLVFLIFVVYNANFRLIRWDDSIPARLLPFNLALHGTFYLEPWINPYLPTVHGALGIYFARKVGPHWLSGYPVILPLVVAPLYVYPAWWFSQLRIDPAGGDLMAYAVADVMEKLSASLVAALSVGVLYLALRKLASRRSSLLLSAVYGVASSTWSISSQSLYRQGFTELSFALLLCALLRDSESPTYAFWIGGAVALVVSNAPHYILFAVLFSVFFFLRQPRRLWLFCVPLVTAGGLTLAYFLHYFGLVSGPYSLPRTGQNPALPFFYPSWDGFAGQLISPSRGLLIFIPWVAFALWGCVRAWRENKFGWERYLILGMAIVFGLHARLGGWWAGWCFGPRYLTDFLPLLVFFILPVWSEIRARTALRVAFGVAVAVALWVQIVGACYYPRGNWDWLPGNVDFDHKRLWDWRDTTISRSWHAGRPEPSLYFELWSLLSANAFAHRGRGSQLSGFRR
jgi:hypothetical protein